MSPNLRTSFWSRMGLQEADRDVCIRAIQALYPRHEVEVYADQGYCSFTLAVSPAVHFSGNHGEYVVQIRPRQHALDGKVTEAAREVYGRLAPEVRMLECELPGDLRAVEMQRLEGVPLSKVRVETGSWEKQVRLVEDFAKVIAAAWPVSADGASSRRSRVDTPTEGLWLESHCTGKVGRVIVPKLRKLAAELPHEALRATARDTLARLLAIEDFPVVLNHGDLIPSNILVNETSWEVTGLVDWAEAEWLPFGTCLYGLEYLLGGLEPVSSADGIDVKPVWRYRRGGQILRRMFWHTLKRERPEMGGSVEDVKCMRDVGVLLWFGYAWDEGAIDRVVNEVDDTQEVACLREFLEVR